MKKENESFQVVCEILNLEIKVTIQSAIPTIFTLNLNMSDAV